MKNKNHHFSLTPTWPDSLPNHCHACHKPYDIRSALEIGPGPFGRFLRKAAPWMSIVMLILMFATKLSFLGLGGGGGAMAFAAALVFPSVVLWVLAGLLPIRARLYCFKCDSSTFFKTPKKLDNRIAKVSE